MIVLFNWHDNNKKDVITKNEVLKDDDKLSETLFEPPTKELDV